MRGLDRARSKARPDGEAFHVHKASCLAWRHRHSAKWKGCRKNCKLTRRDSKKGNKQLSKLFQDGYKSNFGCNYCRSTNVTSMASRKGTKMKTENALKIRRGNRVTFAISPQQGRSLAHAPDRPHHYKWGSGSDASITTHPRSFGGNGADSSRPSQTRRRNTRRNIWRNPHFRSRPKVA